MSLTAEYLRSIRCSQPEPRDVSWRRSRTVHKYLAGHLGGEQQLGAQIEDNDLDLVIFLRNPLQPKPHEPNVGNVLRLCDIHNIPVATNLATAELLIKSMERGEFEFRNYYRR